MLFIILGKLQSRMPGRGRGRGRGGGKKTVAAPKLTEEKKDESASNSETETSHDNEPEVAKDPTPMKKKTSVSKKSGKSVSMSSNSDEKSKDKKIDNKSIAKDKESKSGTPSGTAFKVPKVNQVKPTVINPPCMPLIASNAETVDSDSGNDFEDRQKYAKVAAERDDSAKRLAELEEQWKNGNAKLIEMEQEIKTADVRLAFMEEQLKSAPDYKMGLRQIIGAIGPLSCSQIRLDYILDGGHHEELFDLVAERVAELKGSRIKAAQKSLADECQRTKNKVAHWKTELEKILDNMNGPTKKSDIGCYPNAGDQWEAKEYGRGEQSGRPRGPMTPPEPYTSPRADQSFTPPYQGGYNQGDRGNYNSRSFGSSCGADRGSRPYNQGFRGRGRGYTYGPGERRSGYDNEDDDNGYGGSGYNDNGGEGNRYKRPRWSYEDIDTGDGGEVDYGAE